MKNARIIIARYKKGIMTREQVLNYVSMVYISKFDQEAKKYILDRIE